jgi:hypothetical protein
MSVDFMEVNPHCVIISVLVLYLTILSVAQIMTLHDNINNTFVRMSKSHENPQACRSFGRDLKLGPPIAKLYY